jgi:shikimate dehydrogenase
MLKLALVGKNISHSKSQQMYEEILQEEVNYTLLDFQNESDIPTAKELLLEFDGVSVTSPYKKHFIEESKIDPECKDLNAINCLRLNNNIVEATNTDYKAVKTYLATFNESSSLKVILLGNGAMSFMTQKILRANKISFKVFSRKNNGDITNLDLRDHFENNNDVKLVINSCSREFVFKGKLPKNSIFWDYNYNLTPHLETLPLLCEEYIDGLSMLKSQAVHALEYWAVIPE